MTAARVITADGVALAVRRIRATAPRRAVLVCGHAMMANGRYFGDARKGLAAHLAARGIDVYVIDWRGHGDSRPPWPAQSEWSFMAYVERDLPAVMQWVATDAGCAAGELVYLGHSLGGLVGLAALGEETIDRPRRLVLAATSVWTEGRIGFGVRRAVIELFRYSAALFGAVPAALLRVGTDDENRQYAREISDWVRHGRWRSPDGRDFAAALPGLQVPTLAVVATADRLCRPRDARKLHGRLPQLVKERLVGREAGDARDSDHFAFLRDRSFAPLWDELADFVCGEGGSLGTEHHQRGP